jgi:integrase
VAGLWPGYYIAAVSDLSLRFGHAQRQTGEYQVRRSSQYSKDLSVKTQLAECICPPGKNEVYYNDVVPGLFLKVTPAGPTAYYFRMRPPPARPGERREEAPRQRLGSFKLMTLADAREQAIKRARVVEVEQRDHRYTHHDATTAVYLEDVLRAYLASMREPATQRNITLVFGHLIKAFPKWGLAEFTPRLLKQYVETTCGPNSPKAIARGKPLAGAAKNLVTYVSAAYNLAAEQTSDVQLPPGVGNVTRGVLRNLPWVRVHQVQHRTRAFSPVEWADILQAVTKAQVAYPHDQAIAALELGIRTGSRPSEIVHATLDCLQRGTFVDDQGVERQWVHLILKKHKTTWKGAPPRVIKLDQHGIKVLERAEANRKHFGYTGPYIFFYPSRQRDPLKPPVPRMYRHIHKLQKFCSVPRLTPYAFRGAFINMLRERLGDAALPTIAAAVGHARLQTTVDFYVNERSAKGEEFVRQVGSIFGPLPTPV